MDELVGFLDGPRARGAFLLRSVFDPPWALRIADDSPLTLTAIVHGHAWVVPDDGDPVRLDAGDIGITRGPGHYTVGDDPATAPQVMVLPGQQCVPVADPAAYPAHQGVRTWGNTATGATTMICGVYEVRSEVSRRLLDALPPLLTVPAAELSSPLVGLLATEIARDEPGQDAVLDRLLDLLLITVLRTWFDRFSAPSWWQAHRDPLAGAALRLLHDDPAQPWTVASLAAAVGVSRATLARRFTEVVGEPPMAYLLNWRLTLAADLLREPQATVAEVARRVGYGTPYALSTAFKRVRGVSPREHRETAGV
ncbi:MAG TPA: AraC family transcriptional regulator [Pseudonocardia sp.]|nr:AraC family transcriptional regulator [Pseudonocardia sp.]